MCRARSRSAASRIPCFARSNGRRATTRSTWGRSCYWRSTGVVRNGRRSVFRKASPRSTADRYEPDLLAAEPSCQYRAVSRKSETVLERGASPPSPPNFIHGRLQERSAGMGAPRLAPVSKWCGGVVSPTFRAHRGHDLASARRLQGVRARGGTLEDTTGFSRRSEARARLPRLLWSESRSVDRLSERSRGAADGWGGAAVQALRRIRAVALAARADDSRQHRIDL